MVLKYLFVLVLWMKVASALKGLCNQQSKDIKQDIYLKDFIIIMGSAKIAKKIKCL